MNAIRTFVALILLAGCVTTGFAQSKKERTMWEESEARKVSPEIRMVVTPQICDMEILSKSREIYGPYSFQIKSIDDTTNGELQNFKNNALYLACKEADADAVIEPIFHSYVNEKDSKILIIELSGFPVKYTNFRSATKAEIEMMGVVYPAGNGSVMLNVDSLQPAQGKQNGGK